MWATFPMPRTSSLGHQDRMYKLWKLMRLTLAGSTMSEQVQVVSWWSRHKTSQRVLTCPNNCMDLRQTDKNCSEIPSLLRRSPLCPIDQSNDTYIQLYLDQMGRSEQVEKRFKRSKSPMSKSWKAAFGSSVKKSPRPTWFLVAEIWTSVICQSNQGTHRTFVKLSSEKACT